MRILVCGATGFIGRHVAAALHAAGHEVIGCARDRAAAFRRYPDLGWIKADFAADRAAPDWSRRLAGFDAVVNGVGILRERGASTFRAVHVEAPAALFRACAERGVRRVIHVSALGCDAAPDSEYLSSKLRTERLLAGLDLDWVIVRPSLVYGEDSPSSALFRLLAALPAVPLIGDGAHRLQPIHVGELAEAITRLAARDGVSRVMLELAGPRAVTYREFLGSLRRLSGRGPARYVEVPLPLARLGARLADAVGWGPFGKDTLGMLLRGNVASANAAAHLLGRRPRGVGECSRAELHDLAHPALGT